MNESKIVVTYRKDQSLNQITTGSCNFRTLSNEPILNLENGTFGKRGNTKSQSKKKNLKKILLDRKIDRLNTNFIRKLRMNSIYRTPIQNFQDSTNPQESNDSILAKLKSYRQYLSKKKGIEFQNIAIAIWSFINIIQTVLMLFIFSIMMSFIETEQYSLFFYMRIVSLILYVSDMLLNFTSQRYQYGKKLCYIEQISSHYLKNGFLIDLISILLIPIDIAVKANINIFLTFIYLIKLWQNIKKLQKFEYLYITSKQKQQYYGLIKVFLTNFAIGHFLSVFLNLMPMLNEKQNWHLRMGIFNSPWYIKYVWGYYWGTNIMLTVGFGDITATNQFQAIILVFIQTFSCITLAYNISYVGGLIGSIRQNQQCKKGKLKTFHRMCKQNEVCSQIQSKISNFIQQSYQIKQNFGHQAHDQVMNFLPKNMQRQYRKQANKILFDSLGFLNNLSKKSLLKLAEEVNRKICHPQEIIFRKGGVSDFLILQKGCLALTCKTRSNLDGKPIEHLQVQNGSKPKILSLDFIKNKTLGFNIKSVNYSFVYYLNREQFMESLRSSQMDYQLFCVLKDKDQYIVDENNLYPCLNCKNQFHSKFQCSKLHFVPLKQNVVVKFLDKLSKKRQKRQKFSRHVTKMSSLMDKKQIKKCQIRFIKQNYDEYHYKQIETLLKFYNKTQATLSPKFVETVIETNNLLSQASLKPRRHLGTLMYKNIFQEKAIDKLECLIEATKNEHKFWDFQIDVAHDFRYYFKQGNSESLNKIKKYRKPKLQHPLFGFQI